MILVLMPPSLLVRLEGLHSDLVSRRFCEIQCQIGASTKERGNYHISGLANKVKEHGKIWGQVEHHRTVFRDAQLKLHKQQGGFARRSQSLQQEIDTLQAQVAAAKVTPAPPPMPPPSVPPEGSPPVNADDPSNVQIQELQQDDEEMEEVDEEGDTGSGVGAFLVPPRKKTVRKTFLKKNSCERSFCQDGDSGFGVC